jgi:hypothetical protein
MLHRRSHTRGLSCAGKQTLHEEDSWRLVQGNRRAATRCDKTAVRDSRDNIRSILDRLKMPGDRPTVDLARYAEVRRGWKNVIWNAGLDLPGGTYIERLAHRWRYAATLYQRYAAETRLVRYEDFCERKEETIASLAQRLGLPGRNDIAEKVDEQYQPRGSNREAFWEAFSERPTSTV